LAIFLQFVLLGLGPAGIYALAGQGVVLIYRGSGVLNFAYGAQALVAAEVFVWLWQDKTWPLTAAIVTSIAMSAAVGAVIAQLVMRPLRDRPPVVKIIATLGILALFQQVMVVLFGTNLRIVRNYLPGGTFKMTGTVGVGNDRLTILAIGLAIAVALTLLTRRSTFGALTLASAENQLGVQTLGHSPEAVSTANWLIGSALAGLAGVLIVPITGLDPQTLTLLVVPALAGAMLGGFSSFLGVAAGSLVIGIGQSLLNKYVHIAGAASAFPFLVIILVAAVRGGVIPTRDERAARLPRVGRNRPGVGIVVLIAVAAVIAGRLPNDVAVNLTTTVLFATVALSLVVLTGLAGQISLGQFAIAGIAGFIAARLSHDWGWPFVAVAIVGILVGTLGALVFGLPALRTRGPTLAVATLGLALVVQSMVFSNPKAVGGFAGTSVHAPSIAGINLDPNHHPQRYAAFAVIIFGLVGMVVACARAGRIGRRLLAVRTNERAAAAVGVSITGVKLYAFALAGSIAAVGGILMAFRFRVVVYQQYAIGQSLNVVAFSVIGGIGYVAGALVGGMMVPSGVFGFLIAKVDNLSEILIAISGPVVILILIAYPQGIAATYRPIAVALRRLPVHFPRLRPREEKWTRPARPPSELVVTDLSVRFGAVRAVDGMQLTVRPGTIHGLIGPNGAGKTTLIDAVSGFLPAATGEVWLGDERLTRMSPHRRSRAGVGRSFQSVELFDDLTVRENILIACEPMPWHAWLRDLVPRPEARLPGPVGAMVSDLGLDRILDRLPTEISYGDRKLVGIARALAANPVICLLDEPAAGLSDADTAAVGERLRGIAHERGVGILLVEHDVGLVAAVSDEITVINYGRPIVTGPPSVVLHHPEVVASYLGDELEDAVDGAV
jgi:ABC-type branched-subunit amino acid transport system ATPase component/branched-subunit amino acid ABC-type transport system permease component